jgi:hypothetical protein
VLLERSGPFKNPKVSSGIKPAAFRLVAQILNQLCYRVPHFNVLERLFGLRGRMYPPVPLFSCYEGRKRAVLELRRLVACFPPRQPGFERGSGHVGFVVDKATLGQVFSEYFSFPCQAFHRSLHTRHHPSSANKWLQ